MYNLYPYFTNDGSVGLFSPVDDDIYHSTYGAATEAYEKFIFPAKLENFFLEHNEIKVLDICYGIGYNSKSLINFIFQIQKNLKKISSCRKILSPNIDTVHTNNNCNPAMTNESIYDDNKNMLKNANNSQNYKKFAENIQNCKIYIKALDTDKVLAGLSPFFKNLDYKARKKYKPDFKNEKIEKYLKDNQEPPKYNYAINLQSKNQPVSNINLPISTLVDYPDEINIIMLDKILKNEGNILSDSDILSILNNKKFRQYFNASIFFWAKEYYNTGCNTPICGLKAVLHNIYYNHLTKRYKKALNSPLYKDLIFDLKINDARKEIIKDTNKYNFIFLDAFTPSKCPCLWSIDFFKQLYNHLDDNGMILTYSNSTNIRNAFVNTGFYIGKIYNAIENKFTGTIAVKNKDLIEYELSEYDLGLLKTKAGIFYRDENLTSLNDEIIVRRNLEVENSPLMSSSKYIKSTKKQDK